MAGLSPSLLMPYDPARHGPRRIVGPGFRERVWAAVTTVPPGRVTTYGDVARALGLATAARHVGFALAALPTDRTDVPWYRVVGARGRIAVGGASARRQTTRLRREGVAIAGDRVVDFERRRCAPIPPAS